MDRVVLSLEEVTFRRAHARVLHGVSWTVRRGEHWAVLGPNGAGKTSLIMIATGYQPASTGRVFLLDGYFSEIVLPRARERVALVSAALGDVMLKHRGATTGLEVVLSGRYASLGFYARPEPEEMERARAVLRRMGLEHLADVRYSLMSTGQRQRCLIARSAMADCELAILDEPCAGLDVAAREDLLAALEAACRERPHVPRVLVTHHPEEIVPSISHVLLLRSGRSVAAGRKEDVLTEPNLEATFGIPLRLVRERGRTWIIPRGGDGRPCPEPDPPRPG
ncbi:MAG: ATP-binding cassette domain-containing protein [Candidatus Brocadiaceae bacterium]|nr:ATP-binding cassette domain-containing protein [Candidatus Brocadiaceae bacterium]